MAWTDPGLVKSYWTIKEKTRGGVHGSIGFDFKIAILIETVNH
jgi:hypothetical protein